MSSPLVEGWGDFLSQFHWDWFVTLTFNFDVKTFTAHRRCATWLRELENAAGSPIFWFRGDEYGERFGRFHMHLLIGNVAHLGRIAWMNRWQKRNGFARVFPFDPAKGAAYYVAKYVSKQLGDYELSDNMNAFRVQQPVLKLSGQRVDMAAESAANGLRNAFAKGLQEHCREPVQLPLADFRQPDLYEFDTDADQDNISGTNQFAKEIAMQNITGKQPVADRFSPVTAENLLELLTVNEIAAALRVPSSWVYERTRRRGRERMPHLKLGKYLRFRLREVRTWIEQGAAQ